MGRVKIMCVHLKFDYKKAVQALNFFAIKSGGTINKLKVIKLIFFADRYHLRKYGRPITNDEYFAMEYGPVGSGIKDIAEMNEFWNSDKYVLSYITAPTRYDVKSIKDYDCDVFSESDLEALSFAWDEFGKYDEFKLAEITHQYPEWKRREHALENSKRERMDYKDFFDDPPDNFEKCHPLNPEERKDGLDHLEELAKIESWWS
jgi:uncharacterized phage-associated protein